MSTLIATQSEAGLTGHEPIGTLDNEGYVEAGFERIGSKVYAIRMKRQQFQECRAVSDVVVVTPNGTAPAKTIFTSDGNTFDFMLTKNFAAQVQDAYLHLQFTNSHASASVTPTKVPLMIDHYESKANAGSGSSLVLAYGSQLWQQSMFYGPERMAQWAAMTNTTKTWGPPTAMAPGEVRDFYLPLSDGFFDQTDEDFEEMKQDIRLRFYTKNSVSAGSGTLDLTGCDLWFTEQFGGKFVKERIQKAHMDTIWRSQYLVWQRLTPQVALTKGSKALVDLSALIGKCLFLTVGVKLSDVNAAEAATQYLQLDGPDGSGVIDLLDQKGASILNNGSTIPAAQLRSVVPFFQMNSQFFQYNYLYPISFVPSLAVGQRTAATDEGFFFFNAKKNQLAITPSASANITNGTTYIIEVMAALIYKADMVDGTYVSTLN